MKKSKKTTAFLLSVLMMFSCINMSISMTYGIESSSEANVTQGLEVQGDNSIGLMLANEIETSDEQAQNEEFNDYFIKEFKYMPEMGKAEIEYHAKEDCIIFLGFYDDSGKELYTSVTKKVYANENGYAEMFAEKKLPEYYLIKAFIVSVDNRPLSKPYVYEKCTKVMQDILNTSVSDFENEYHVINLDNDKSNNFIIPKKDAIEIKTSENKNVFVKKSDINKYYFENFDKDLFNTIKLQQEAGVIVYAETPEETILIKVSSISERTNSNGTKTVEIVADTTAKTEDLCSFVKINAAMDDNVEPIYDKTNASEDVEFKTNENGTKAKVAYENDPYALYLPARKVLLDEKYEDSYSKQVIFTYGHFNNMQDKDIDKEVSDSLESASSSANIGLRAIFKFDYTLELYLSLNIFSDENYFSMDFDSGQSVQIDAFAKEEINISLGKVVFPTSSGITFFINPRVPISGEGTISFKYSHEDKLTYNTISGYNYIPESSDKSVFLTGTIQISVKIDFGIYIIDEYFIKATISPEYGVKIKATRTLIDSANKNDYCRDLCDFCADVVSFLRLSFSVDFLKFNFSTSILQPEEDNIYVSLYNGKIKYGYGECPNKEYKIILNVVDKNNKPVKNAEITKKTYNSGVESEKSIATTNEKGEAEFYILNNELKNLCWISAVYKINEENTASDSLYLTYLWDKTLKAPNIFTLTLNTDVSSPADTQNNNENLHNTTHKTEDAVYGSFSTVSEYDLFYYLNLKNGKIYINGKGTLVNDWFRYIQDTYELNSDIIKEVYIGPDVIVNKSSGYILQSFNNLERVTFDENKAAECLPYGAFRDNPKLKQILNIPKSIETSGIDVFAYSAIEYFELPEKMKTIGRATFCHAYDLKTVIFNSELEKIGNIAFQRCGLENLTIPENVKYIGRAAFDNCDSLKNIVINGNPEYVDFSDDSFNNSYDYTDKIDSPGDNNIIFSNCDVLESVYFSDDAVNNAAGMFFNCKSLKKVRLSPNTTIINNEMFSYCTNLSDITIPESVTTIGESAFSYCDNLSNIVLPKSVGNIGKSAFLKGVNTPMEITVLNKNCKFNDIIASEGTIFKGYTGSTTEDYVNKYTKDYGYKFIPLDKENTVTTTMTTTTSVSTTTTTITELAFENVVPNSEYILVSVKDTKIKDEINSTEDNIIYTDRSVIELLDINNVSYFDQQTSDENGIVKFSLVITEESKNNTYIFVDEFNKKQGTINEIIKKESEATDDEPSKVTLYGDANNNGKVDMSDAVLIMQSLSNPEKYSLIGSDKDHITKQGLLNADCYNTGDGVTNSDSLSIQRYCLSLIDSLPE